MKDIIVSNAASEKLQGRFPWVYDNEVLKYPKGAAKGEVVNIYSPVGVFLGMGYVNASSAIAVRVMAFETERIDKSYFVKRISKALLRRGAFLKQTDAYRAVHSEADDLPGLIVDVYGSSLAVQINTAGMESWRHEIIEALAACLQPLGICEKSDARSREKEGLSTQSGVLWGEVPEKIRIREDDVLFEVRLAEGQKTGFYLDQRRNRTVVAGYVVPGCRVLDVFCNTGGFGIRTGLKGAGYVRLVDVSQPALDGALENARLNGLSAVETLRADAFDYLAAAVSSGESYDMVILDPPSFTKTKGAKRGAIRGFRQLVSTALALLNPEGYLALFSCSHHVSQEDLMQISLEVSAGAGWRLMVMEQFFQDRDHPHLLNFPPSLYLKGLLLKKIP